MLAPTPLARCGHEAGCLSFHGHCRTDKAGRKSFAARTGALVSGASAKRSADERQFEADSSAFCPLGWGFGR